MNKEHVAFFFYPYTNYLFIYLFIIYLFIYHCVQTGFVSKSLIKIWQITNNYK